VERAGRELDIEVPRLAAVSHFDLPVLPESCQVVERERPKIKGEESILLDPIRSRFSLLRRGFRARLRTLQTGSLRLERADLKVLGAGTGKATYRPARNVVVLEEIFPKGYRGREEMVRACSRLEVGTYDIAGSTLGRSTPGIR
jgi:hypothetical protein